MRRLLLHDCCAPCGAYVLEELLKDGYEVTVYFYNPNIFPLEEYEWRKQEIKKYCQKRNVKFIDDDYNHEDWLDFVKGHETAPERGKRCEQCFAKRLGEAAQKASELGVEYMTTTLTISPHKISQMIINVGKEVSEIYGIKFLDIDWKKDDGFKKACVLSKEEGFHRQNYCGCEFSMKRKTNG